jgi:hypothetical protein
MLKPCIVLLKNALQADCNVLPCIVLLKNALQASQDETP